MQQITVGIAGLLLFAATGCSSTAPPEQIRLDAPADAQQVVHIDRLTDGQRSFEGSAWNSKTAAIFRGSRAYVIFDLGEVTPIDAVYLQGDNNDEFILETSEDHRPLHNSVDGARGRPTRPSRPVDRWPRRERTFCKAERDRWRCQRQRQRDSTLLGDALGLAAEGLGSRGARIVDLGTACDALVWRDRRLGRVLSPS